MSTCYCQQMELYSAEEKAPRGATFADIDDIQAWVDRLRDTWWWQKFYPQVRRIEVYAAPLKSTGSVGHWHADKYAGVIEMHPEHRYVRVVLHEIAHVLAAARYGSRSHDPAFARVYLELMSLTFPDGYLPLWKAFTDAKIEFDFADEALGRARPMPKAS